MSEKHGAFPARHFTVQTLAEHWDVSPSHIYNLINNNSLRHMRIGKAIRIPVIFVTEFEEAACQTTRIFTDYGSTITGIGTSSGQAGPKVNGPLGVRDGYQRGQQTAEKQNNSAPNTSQD